MTRFLFGAALLLALTGRLAAQDPPKGSAPLIMTANVGKDGKPFIIRTTYRSVAREEVYEVNVNGQIEKRKRVVAVTIPVMTSLQLDVAGLRVYDVDGKQLDANSLKLTRATPVLVSADGRPVDPFYTRLARPGTLVLVVPGLNEEAMPLPMAVIPPKEKIAPPKKINP